MVCIGVNILPVFVDKLYNWCTLCPTLDVITSKDYVLQLCPEIEHYVCPEITHHTQCPAAPHADNDQSCALLQSAEASAALQTFYDRQLASCEVQGPRAGHGPYHGLVQHFKPKMGANKKSAGVCCSLQHFANDHGSLVVYSGTFSFPASCFLERVGKFSVSPLSWHFITTVAKTDVPTRAFDPRTTMELLRQVQIIQFGICCVCTACSAPHFVETTHKSF